MKECGCISVYLDGDSIKEALTLVVCMMITAPVCRRRLRYTAGLVAAAGFYCVCVKTGLFVWAGLAAASRLLLCVDVIVCVGRLGCCHSTDLYKHWIADGYRWGCP